MDKNSGTGHIYRLCKLPRSWLPLTEFCPVWPGYKTKATRIRQTHLFVLFLWFLLKTSKMSENDENVKKITSKE